MRRSLFVSSVRREVVQKALLLPVYSPKTRHRATTDVRGAWSPSRALAPVIAEIARDCTHPHTRHTRRSCGLSPRVPAPVPPVSRLDRVCCIRACGISRAGAPGRCGLRALERGALVTRYQSAKWYTQYPSFHWPARSSGRTPPPALWGHCRLCLSSPLSDSSRARLLPTLRLVRPAAGRQSSTTRPSSMSLRMPRCGQGRGRGL